MSAVPERFLPAVGASATTMRGVLDNTDPVKKQNTGTGTGTQAGTNVGLEAGAGAGARAGGGGGGSGSGAPLEESRELSVGAAFGPQHSQTGSGAGGDATGGASQETAVPSERRDVLV